MGRDIPGVIDLTIKTTAAGKQSMVRRLAMYRSNPIRSVMVPWKEKWKESNSSGSLNTISKLSYFSCCCP